MRTLRLTLVGAVALTLLGSTVAAQEAEPTTALSAANDLHYTDGGSELDVYAPSEPGPWPVVVLVHSALETRHRLESLAQAIATDGAVVYNVDASIAPPYPDATGRVACAVRFARATAAEHGGDATRVALVGDNAGAAIGMVVALAGDDYGEDCVVTDEPALVGVFVGWEGPYAWTTTGGREPLPAEEDDQALWQALDPYAHIGKNPDLVVRLVHGDREDRVAYETPLDMSVEFDQALRDAGYDTELTVVPGAGLADLRYRDSKAGEVILRKLRESTAAPAE